MVRSELLMHNHGAHLRTTIIEATPVGYAARPLPLLSCHSRESGNPVTSFLFL
jgi:hypothetical protein